MKADAFGEYLRRYQNYIIVLGLKGSRIKISEKRFACPFVRRTREQNNLLIDLSFNLFCKILGCFFRFSEDNQLALAKSWNILEDFAEGVPFWIAPHSSPHL